MKIIKHNNITLKIINNNVPNVSNYPKLNCTLLPKLTTDKLFPNKFFIYLNL